MEEVKVKVRIPTNWNDITLETYLKYRKTLDLYKDDDEDDEIDMVNKSIIIALDILCGVAPTFASQMPVEMLSHVMESLNKFMTDTTFDLQRIITIDGIEYGFEPNLSNMAYGAYLDISKYDKITIDNNWTKIMSILYRPITQHVGKLYTIEPYDGTKDERIELFKHVLTMDVVFGATAFFLNLQKDLRTGILTYTQTLMTENKDPRILAALEDLEKNGVDITQLQSFLTTTSQNLTV